MPVFEGPDCSLWVEVVGSGEPLTVFAHGVTGSTDELTPLARATPGTRVLLDFRGHGRSACPPPEAGYDHPAMRRDLEAVADAFGATRAVGLSMGGGACLNLLADRPDRFERLVLFLPASIDGPNGGAAPVFLWVADLLETRSLEEVVEISMASETNAALFAKRPYWRELVARRIRLMNATGVPRALRGYTHGAPPVADASALARVRAPALVLAQEGDGIHDVAVAARLATLLPDARLQVWPEPFSMYDDPGALARLIGEFVGA